MPEYPDILKRAGFEPIVQLSALVNEQGEVTDVKVIKSVPIVDSVCVVAAQKWKFEPGKLADANGEYQPAKFWVPIFFDWSNSREMLVQAY